MVKIFVGNLPREANQEEIKALFTEYGTVTECAIIKNYAFVHMDDRKAATKAIKNLHLHKLHGTAINVEASHGKNPGAVKLHVANVEKGADDELRALFEEYGSVTECAVVKNFAFVHMSNSDEAMDAIKGLDNTEFQGKAPRTSPSFPSGWGGGGVMECEFVCVFCLQGNAFMSRSQRVAPDTKNRTPTLLLPQTAAATGLLVTQATNTSPPRLVTCEAASAPSPLVTPRLPCRPLRLDGLFTPTDLTTPRGIDMAW
ncbi:unnamed protein product [Tetraodon nigroviridis]|uniref:(spotted green pufferfish) hypothetical protein n=1 Tax=Tetraodon nigroviridis TaxID=99883 RepID=Q4SYG3_TETNG|nr:unnamed protein product [Tetraodon nigroviridis]